MNIINIDGENLHILWTTWEISMKFSGNDLWFTYDKKPGLHPLFRRYILAKATRVGGSHLPIATKPGRVMTWKITWQTKTIISPLLQCLWPPNLPGWSLSWGAPSNMTFNEMVLLRSCDSLKRLYLNFHKAYDY